jgi:hypothetical protein
MVRSRSAQNVEVDGVKIEGKGGSRLRPLEEVRGPMPATVQAYEGECILTSSFGGTQSRREQVKRIAPAVDGEKNRLMLSVHPD